MTEAYGQIVLPDDAAPLPADPAYVPTIIDLITVLPVGSGAQCATNPTEPKLGSDFQILVGGLEAYQQVNIVANFGGVILGRVVKAGDDGGVSSSFTAGRLGDGVLVVNDTDGNQLATSMFGVVE